MSNQEYKKQLVMREEQKLDTYFLACEFKPYSSLWSVIDPFAYDVKPAFIYGSLGITNYDPESYSVIDVYDGGQPLMGYICTITHPDTVSLLDKIKGWNGPDAFNMHLKTVVQAHTDIETIVNAYCYIISDEVLEAYEQIEQIEFGLWDEDELQIHLLEEIESHYD